MFDNDFFIGLHEAQHDTGALVKHIEVETVGAQQLDAVFEGLPLGPLLVVLCLGLGQLFLQTFPGEISAVSVRQVIGEVKKQPETDESGQIVGNGFMLSLFRNPHIPMESQTSHRVNKKANRKSAHLNTPLKYVNKICY